MFVNVCWCLLLLLLLLFLLVACCLLVFVGVCPALGPYAKLGFEYALKRSETDMIAECLLVFAQLSAHMQNLVLNMH